MSNEVNAHAVIHLLEQRVSALVTENAALQARIIDLEAQVKDLQAKKTKPKPKEEDVDAQK